MTSFQAYLAYGTQNSVRSSSILKVKGIALIFFLKKAFTYI